MIRNALDQEPQHQEMFSGPAASFVSPQVWTGVKARGVPGNFTNIASGRLWSTPVDSKGYNETAKTSPTAPLKKHGGRSSRLKLLCTSPKGSALTAKKGNLGRVGLSRSTLPARTKMMANLPHNILHGRSGPPSAWRVPRLLRLVFLA